MKKRHVYDLVILLAAGTIMMSACGKKPDTPADTTVPAQTESQTETSAEGTSSPEETSSETQVPEDTESSKFYMLQGTITKLKKTALHLPYWLTTEKSIRLLFLIFMMWKQRLKRTPRSPSPV